MRLVEEIWPLKKAKMEEHKRRLTRRCSIQKKSSRTNYYVIRWRERTDGHVVKRSIYLGSPEIAEKARMLIEEWRREEEDQIRRRFEGLRKALGSYAPGFLRKMA